MQGDAAAAGLDSLRDAARRAPDDAAAQQAYGLAAERAELYPEALAAIDRAVAVGGAVPARLVAQGRIGLEAGDVPAAARAFTRTLDLDPGNIDALNGLGVAEDLERHHSQAQERYSEALRLAPGDWKVRSNLAMSLLMSGRAHEAAGTLAGADHDPAAPRRARHDLALALVAADKREQAIGVLEADMPAQEAATLADEFAGFARWLASPEGSRPAMR
jgi:tetratricopeptide (TPR) repeat protein